MNEFRSMLGALSTAQRVVLGLAFVILVAITVALSWWALRTPTAVLFSGLADKDAALIAGELDKLKQPYEVSADGQAILVPRDAVHKARMALMGRQLPLQGAVGFELFNNAEFGVSDFVQKVNYQRALQGELTRTILALEQVKSARVHLALPDQALFRKEGPRAKASVTVTMQPGQVLAASQVMGIQRLVSASVPDIHVDDVTVLDQNGVALSRVADDGAGPMAAPGLLDAKQAAEQQLTRKAAQLLDRMFKPGDSLVTVDVVLNHQQSRVVTEEVLGAAAGRRDLPAAGVLVHERTSTREAPTADGTKASAAVTTQESDFQTGKRVEQVTSNGGNVARISVAVVVRQLLSDAEVSRVKAVVGTSVGLLPARGDVIAVYTMADVHNGLQQGAGTSATPAALPTRAALTPAVTEGPEGGPERRAGSDVVVWLAWLVGLAVLAVLATLWWRSQARRPVADRSSERPLSAAEREALLRSVQRWMGNEPGRA